MDHPDYLGLSGNAVRLLLELARQYRGSNNGDLTAAWSLMNKRGFRSKATLNNAAKELLDARLISRTRVGRFTNPGGVCALYALTWQRIDECKGKLDAASTPVPLRRFSEEIRELNRQSAKISKETTPNNKKPCTESVPTRPRICTDNDPESVPSTSLIAPVFGSIRRYRLVQKPYSLLSYQGYRGSDGNSSGANSRYATQTSTQA